MDIRDVVDHLEGIAAELKFARHVRGRLTELREVHEKDEETFDRVIDEVLDVKYPLANPRRKK